MKEDEIELLNEIARFEDSHDMEKKFKTGWSWRHVRIWLATLNRLFRDGYLDNVFKSNSYTGYRLTDLGKAVATQKETQPAETTQLQELGLPDDLFDDIIGH
jgi:Holliday junction DNA helicase RuvB